MPAINSLKKSGDINSAAAQVSSAISQARGYALANNTYTWIGFYEEDGSQNSTTPATAGTGRVVMALVASADGTLPYTASSPSAIPTGNLTQISRLIKVNNLHLVTFPATVSGTLVTSPGTVTISNPSIASIGDSTPAASSLTPFTFPLGGTTQYTFTKAIQFNPRGEARVDNSTTAYPMQPAIEVGLQSTEGKVVDPKSVNLVSIQITGIGGDVTIYRK